MAKAPTPLTERLKILDARQTIAARAYRRVTEDTETYYWSLRNGVYKELDRTAAKQEYDAIIARGEVHTRDVALIKEERAQLLGAHEAYILRILTEMARAISAHIVSNITRPVMYVIMPSRGIETADADADDLVMPPTDTAIIRRLGRESGMYQLRGAVAISLDQFWAEHADTPSWEKVSNAIVGVSGPYILWNRNRR
jgi:hypothetical protein